MKFCFFGNNIRSAFLCKVSTHISCYKEKLQPKSKERVFSISGKKSPEQEVRHRTFRPLPTEESRTYVTDTIPSYNVINNLKIKLCFDSCPLISF